MNLNMYNFTEFLAPYSKQNTNSQMTLVQHIMTNNNDTASRL